MLDLKRISCQVEINLQIAGFYSTWKFNFKFVEASIFNFKFRHLDIWQGNLIIIQTNIEIWNCLLVIDCSSQTLSRWLKLPDLLKISATSKILKICQTWCFLLIIATISNLILLLSERDFRSDRAWLERRTRQNCHSSLLPENEQCLWKLKSEFLWEKNLQSFEDASWG